MFSIKSFLIPAFCTLSLSLSADPLQSFDEDRKKFTYPYLDNTTETTDEDLQANPFLISHSPQCVDDAHIEIDEDQIVKLVWTQSDSNCSYLIFGSNSIDFTPSVYIEEESTSEAEDNFLGETTEAYFPIEKRFAYFRIITKHHESYSYPSKILPACDALLASESDLPRCGFDEAADFFKKKIDAKHHKTQKRVSKDQAISTEYVRNPYVSEELWNALSPYFLPENSPEKAALDSIFTKRRVLSSIKSMYKSGFNLITNHNDKIIVARHPYLKGYLIKAYTDDMPYPDWYWWKKRIDGINAIQTKIVESGYQGIMKTPRKWIYPLPAEPSPKVPTPDRKNFILVVEEMDILDYKKNKKAYKNQMTPQILDAFYIVLSDLRLIDSVYSDNTPFCKDGRLAFVDSEHSLDTTRPVPLSNVAQYLSPEMYSYWEQLIIRGGPSR